MYNDTRVLLNYRRLNHVKRCNNFPVVIQESVAEHSFNVTLLAMAIATEYNDFAGSNNMKYHPYDDEHHMDIVDVNEVIRKALAHDLEESFTSDIPWNVKHHSDESLKAVGGAIKAIEDDVYDGADTMAWLFRRYCDTCKDGLSGELVKVADMLELALYLVEEISRGNKYMLHLCDKAIELVRSYELYDTLMESSPTFRDIMAFIMNMGAGSHMVPITD